MREELAHFERTAAREDVVKREGRSIQGSLAVVVGLSDAAKGSINAEAGARGKIRGAVAHEGRRGVGVEQRVGLAPACHDVS